MDLTPNTNPPAQKNKQSGMNLSRDSSQDSANYQNQQNQPTVKIYTFYWINVFKTSQQEDDIIECTFEIPFHYTVIHVIDMIITSLNQKLMEQQNAGSLLQIKEKYQLRRAKKSNKPD